MAKSPEFKKLLGERAMNSDGFTYAYGKYNEYQNDNRHKELIARCRRADKKAVKRNELKRLMEDE